MIYSLPCQKGNVNTHGRNFFPWVLIIFSGLVYCKSDLHWQREIRSQQQGGSSSQDTSGPHQQQARQCAISISRIRKRRPGRQQVSQTQVLRQQGYPPHGSQPWRIREPQGNEGQAVSNWKPFDGGGDTPPNPLPWPVFPGIQPGKTGTGTEP